MKLILKALADQRLTIDSVGKSLHNRLKHLGYEESGHTGFQKELTDEQIQAINQVAAKEDKSNKSDTIWNEDGDNAYPTTKAIINDVYTPHEQRIGDIETDLHWKEDSSNKVISINETSTDMQYPSAKATFDGIQNKTGWELVKVAVNGEVVDAAGTLEADVTQISWTFAEKYKELYVHFKLPTINPDKTSNFPKARIFLYPSKVNVSKCIYYDQMAVIPDTGVNYHVNFHIQTFGNNCTTQREFLNNESSITCGYALEYNLGYRAFNITKKIDNPYIDMLTALLYPTETRCFPTGTVYEIWGVKA